MKKYFISAVCCLLMVAGMVSCGGNSPEAVVEKAMGCLINGDAEGYSQLMLEPNPGRASHIIKEIAYKHKSIVDYKIKSVEKMEAGDGKIHYWVTLNMTNERKNKGIGYMFLVEDENGELKLDGDGVSDWPEHGFMRE